MSARARIEAEVVSWPGVETGPGRFGSRRFTIGRRELGHLHGDEIADLPLRPEVARNLIAAGHGIGLLPLGRPTGAGVRVLALVDPRVVLTAYAVVRRGREDWSPLRVLLDHLSAASRLENPYLPATPHH